MQMDKLIQPLWRIVWRFFKTLGIKPPCDSAIPLLGMYPEETKIEKGTCIPLFRAFLITLLLKNLPAMQETWV